MRKESEIPRPTLSLLSSNYSEQQGCFGEGLCGSKINSVQNSGLDTSITLVSEDLALWFRPALGTSVKEPLVKNGTWETCFSYNNSSLCYVLWNLHVAVRNLGSNDWATLILQFREWNTSALLRVREFSRQLYLLIWVWVKTEWYS